MCITLINFVQIGQTVAEKPFIRFSKTAAVRHLGFVVRLLGPPTRRSWWSLSAL